MWTRILSGIFLDYIAINHFQRKTQKPAQTRVSFPPCYSVTSTAVPWNLYFVKLTQPLTVSRSPLLCTVKEKEGKPDSRPHPHLYGLRNFRNPYRNLKSENSQDNAQKPQRFTLTNSASVLSFVSLCLGQLGCVSSSDGTPCDTPLSQASRVKRRNKKKRPITIGSTTIIPLKGAQTWTFFKYSFYGMFR